MQQFLGNSLTQSLFKTKLFHGCSFLVSKESENAITFFQCAFLLPLYYFVGDESKTRETAAEAAVER
jgi:hypothetical protein